MAENGRFKKTLFGFRKSAVLDYVEAYQRESQTTIDTLQKELDDCREQLARANAENAELEAKVRECTAAVHELHELADALQAQVKEQVALHNRIGDVYVEAKADAKRIVEDADADAKNILKAADDTASMTVRHIDDTVSELSGVKTSMDSLARHLGDKLAQIDAALAAAKRRLSPSKRTDSITSDDLQAQGVLPTRK